MSVSSGRAGRIAAIEAQAVRADDARALVARVQAGDAAAFDTLVATHYLSLYRLAYRYVRRRDMAEELVQDVLLRVAELGAEWNATESIGGYLATATRYAALNALRRMHLESRWREAAMQAPDLLGLATHAPSPDTVVQASELRSAIARAVAALPTRCREAFLLHRERDLSYAEIASVMGISPATVKIQMGRALKALRHSLQAYLPDAGSSEDDLR